MSKSGRGFEGTVDRSRGKRAEIVRGKEHFNLRLLRKGEDRAAGRLGG